MTISGPVDEKYYQVVPPRSLRERLLTAARDRIYDDFVRVCRPEAGDEILDVGVSDIINEAANMVERKYPYPDRITAAGLSSARDFRAAFPHITYTRIAANRPLPFADRSFAIATSNAVLEHVGSRPNQAFFVRELCRVADKVFISVPNRYFPVEHHTAIPFLHYGNGAFFAACHWLGKGEWADEANLILMSKGSLAALAPDRADAVVDYTGIRLGPLSSNIYLFLRH